MAVLGVGRPALDEQVASWTSETPGSRGALAAYLRLPSVEEKAAVIHALPQWAKIAAARVDQPDTIDALLYAERKER